MLSTFKAEIYKLLTVRSTYALTAVSAALTAFWGFYIAGWLAKPAGLHDPGFMVAQMANIIGISALLLGFIGILHITSEYRYGTIMYTLTASNSRTKVLLAKILAISGFAVVFTLIIAALSLATIPLGIHAHSLTLVPQSIHFGDVLWRTLFYGWGFAMAGLVVGLLIRNQVGAIVLFFLLNGPLEGIPDLLLRKNSVYLPFDALGNLLGSASVNTVLRPVSHITLALAFVADLAVTLTVAWILFLKRDAS